jgi:cysteine desulfuration protein SufE
MSDASGALPLPPSVERVLRYFRSLGREEKMQALVAYSKRLEPVPERFKSLPREAFSVPECMTSVDLYPEERDGRLHFYANVDARQSPTVAAFLAVLLQAVNDQPAATILAIPSDFVRQLMEGIGLAAREVGLNAILNRVKRHAAAAAAPA